MSKETQAAEAAEFTALLDELGDTADTSADTSADAPEPEVSDTPAPEPELEPAQANVAKLLEDGDLDAAAKALGVDPSVFKLDKRGFAAMRKGVKDARAKESEAIKAKQEAEKLQQEAEKTYRPIVDSYAAGRAGDGTRLRRALEMSAEMGWEQIKALCDKAGQPPDAATAEVLRLRRELAERDQKATKADAETKAAAQAKADIAAIGAKLAATPLAKVPGAAQKIYDRVKASHDGTGYTLSVRDAYAEVKAEAMALAAAFGAPAAPQPAKKRLEPVRKAKPATRIERRKAEEDEFTAVLREAEAAIKAQERAGRRAR